MYGIDCEYFKEEFDSIGLLVKHIQMSGMDPNYEVTKNGIGIGELAVDFFVE